MKSFFCTKLYLHPLATPWTMRIESLRKSSAVESPGGDFGVKTLETLVLSQRLRPSKLGFLTKWCTPLEWVRRMAWSDILSEAKDSGAHVLCLETLAQKGWRL
jgi:hypothetical protein